MTHLIPNSRVLHLLDAALAAWVAAWIGLGEWRSESTSTT